MERVYFLLMKNTECCLFLILLSKIITISYNERLFLIGLLLGLNYAISKIIIRRLKKRDYVNRIITKFDLSNNSKYNSFLFCLFLLFAYTVIPIVPIVLYFVFKLLASGQIRKIRHVCIFRINGLEVFLWSYPVSRRFLIPLRINLIRWLALTPISTT